MSRSCIGDCSKCFQRRSCVVRLSCSDCDKSEADKLTKENLEKVNWIQKTADSVEEIKSVLESKLHFLQMKWQPGLATGANCDAVVLQAADGQCFPVHHFILVSRSRVFDAMLRVNMIEKLTNMVKLDDMGADVLRLFVEFLYSADSGVEDLEKYSPGLLLAAHKYEVDLLYLTCQSCMSKNMNTDTVFSYLEVAHLCDSNAVKFAAFDFLKTHRKLDKLDEKLLALINKYPQLAFDFFKYLIINP